MKWFKLMTDFDDDEKIVTMTEREGPLSQARLLKIYRIVAKQMNETERCEVRYPASKWSKALWFRSAIDCRSFLDRLTIDQLLIADLITTDWVVRVPNLLKIRARKKPIGSKTCLLEVEADTDTEVEKKRAASKPLVMLSADCVWVGILDTHKALWKNAYPAVDIDLEMNKMAAYIKANPKKRKKNWERFITNWLSRTQDKGGSFAKGIPQANSNGGIDTNQKKRLIAQHFERQGKFGWTQSEESAAWEQIKSRVSS